MLRAVLPGQELEEDDEECTCEPEFAERIFGEDGKIYGYTGLKIDLWFHAATFHAFVRIVYDSKSAGGKKSPCTDVLGKLQEVFGDGLMGDRDSFQQSLLSYSDDFQQMLEKHGEVLCSWQSKSSRSFVVNGANADAEHSLESPDKLKQIVRVELVDAAVRAWHAHLTPFCLLFVEGSQPIESDDPLWEVYLALEGEGSFMKVTGFCNVYRFYHYPDSTRLRISQILVLPPYQGDGFGLHLLQTVNMAATDRSCYDVTMEEPSVVLQKLRDTMDILRLLSLPSLDETVKDAICKLDAKKRVVLSSNRSEGSGDEIGALVDFNGSSVDVPRAMSGLKEKSLLVPPPDLVEKIRKKLKISKMQFKRCWEQLLFMYLDSKDRDLQDVFQEVLVQRLNLEVFEKENANRSLGKLLVDTDNEYDNSRTFVMMRSRKTDHIGQNLEESNVGGDEVSALTPGLEEKRKALQEALKEREDELLAVAQAVARCCRASGLRIPSLQMWQQVTPGTSEPAT